MGTRTPEATLGPGGGGPVICTVSRSRDSLPQARKHLRDKRCSRTEGRQKEREEGTPLVFLWRQLRYFQKQPSVCRQKTRHASWFCYSELQTLDKITSSLDTKFTRLQSGVEKADLCPGRCSEGAVGLDQRGLGSNPRSAA